MEDPSISRFSKLSKDMLITLLETLAPIYIFSYDYPFLNVSLLESSSSLPVFSINVKGLYDFERFENLVYILSGKADFSILKKTENKLLYQEYENGWFAGVTIYSSNCSDPYYDVVQYHLGILCLDEDISLEIFEDEAVENESSEISRKEPTFNLSLPFVRCDIGNLEETLFEILGDLEERDRISP